MIDNFVAGLLVVWFIVDVLDLRPKWRKAPSNDTSNPYLEKAQCKSK